MRKILYSLLAVSLLFASCKKEEIPTPVLPVVPSDTLKYEIPTTYNFSNVNYIGQTQRILMTDELITYIKTANTSGTSLDVLKLKEMYTNTNSRFADNTLNTSGKQLKDKVYSLDQDWFTNEFDSTIVSNNSTVAASNGVAGVLTSPNDATKKYLVNKYGFEHKETVEKGIMGALMYYQIQEVYLSDSKTGDQIDNSTVTAGEGTPLEHHWDEAFGYLGVPIDFPTNKTGLKYWGKYANSIDAKINCNKKLMDAFLKGRAAISNKDLVEKTKQRTIIKEELERICAARAISYINSAKANFSDEAVRNHNLSEAIGFVRALKYNSTKKITQAQIDEAISYFNNNLYTITSSNLDSIRDLLSSVYGFESIKTTL